MTKQILKFLVFAKVLTMVLGVVYIFALASLGSPGMAMVFTFLIAAALALPIALVFDKVMTRSPIRISGLAATETCGKLTLFGKKTVPLPQKGVLVQTRTKKGRHLRTGRVVGIDRRRGYPRIRIQHTGIPGNRSTFLRRPEELVLLAA